MINDYFEFCNSAKIISGENSLDNISFELRGLEASNILIITDRVLESLGSLDYLLSKIDSSFNIKYIFKDTPKDSSIEVVNSLSQIYKDNNCDTIIALGGGSVIDTSKGVRMVIKQDKNDLLELCGAEILTKGKNVNFIAIPTTSGTGSECTLVSVIKNNETGVKMEFISYFLVPDVAILDSNLLVSLPKGITASCAIDALTHAIEAKTCLQKNLLSDAYATSAIKIIYNNLEKTIKNLSDKKLRLSLANASMLAGVAFSNSMVGLVHAIGHSLGSIAQISHANAMSILLPHVMAFNSDKVSYMEVLCDMIGYEKMLDLKITNYNEYAIKMINDLLISLNKLAGLPLRLRDLNVSEDLFDEIADLSLKDGAIIVNPKKAHKEDIINILKEAY